MILDATVHSHSSLIHPRDITVCNTVDLAAPIATLPEYYQCQNVVPYLCVLLPPLFYKDLDQLLILLVQLALLQASTPM